MLRKTHSRRQPWDTLSARALVAFELHGGLMCQRAVQPRLIVGFLAWEQETQLK